MEPAGGADSSRRASGGPAEGGPPMLHDMVAGMVVAMEEQGTVTHECGKIVGGVAMAQPFYAAALYAEGRAPEGATAAPCQVVLTARHTEGIDLIAATQEEMLEGRAHLPRESAVLSQLLSPAAISAYHWARPPAVVIFGCLAADDEALDRCEAAGVPISPSMVGPHPEELITQLQVFLKQFRFPEHKAFILMDWGFMVFGSDIEDAAAAYDSAIRTHLMGFPPAPAPAPPADAAAGGAAAAGAPKALGGLMRRLGGLLRRSNSDNAEASGIEAHSEPSSPLLGVLQQARANFFSQGGPAGGCGGACGAPGAVCASAASAAAMGPKAAAGAAAAAAPAAEQLPDDIRAAPGSLNSRRESDHNRIPSFQTGMKPW